MARAPGTVHGRQSGRRPRSGLSRRPMAGERSPLASSVADNAMWAKVGSCSRSEWLMPGFARRFGPGQGGPTQDWPKTDFIQFKEVQRSAGSNKPRRMGSTVLTGGVSPRGSGASRCRSRSRPSGAIGRDVAMLPSFRRTSPAALPKAGTPRCYERLTATDVDLGYVLEHGELPSWHPQQRSIWRLRRSPLLWCGRRRLRKAQMLQIGSGRLPGR